MQLAIKPRRERGFTMMEVLVTLVVISVGLLAVVALHLTSLKNNMDAHMRSQASSLAADISDRMRANRNAALAGDYTITLTTATPTLTGTPTLAQRDLNAWRNTLAQILPSGTGAVAINANRLVTITIQWGERGTTLSFTTDTEV